MTSKWQIIQKQPNIYIDETSTVSPPEQQKSQTNTSTEVPNPSARYSFIHEDPRFKSLLKMCGEERGIDPSIVEKDYYISHVLWCLRKKGLEIQLKGGVSLAKGFGVIHRLSEDVDLVITPNTNSTSFLHEVVSQLFQMDMKSKLKTRERAKLWIKFSNMIKKGLPGLDVVVGTKDSPFYDPRWGYLVLNMGYNQHFPPSSEDPHLMNSGIVVEVALSQEDPLDPIPVRLSSFLHNFLERKKLLHQFKRNIPTVLCTHPMITLIQKISDGIINRFQRPVEVGVPMPYFASGLRGKVPPFDPRIIRHYEDAAAMILEIESCYPLRKNSEYTELYIQLMERRMVRRKPEAGTIIHDDESILLQSKDQDKLDALITCQQQRLCLYYECKVVNSSRSSPLPLEECAKVIREWLCSIGL